MSFVQTTSGLYVPPQYAALGGDLDGDGVPYDDDDDNMIVCSACGGLGTLGDDITVCDVCDGECMIPR